jgi:hypothetical protein
MLDKQGQETIKMTNQVPLYALSFIIVALLVGWMIKRSATQYDEVYAGDTIPKKDHPF